MTAIQTTPMTWLRREPLILFTLCGVIIYLAWVRYEGGNTSYLEVLDLQRSFFSSQLKSSEAQQLQLTSTVRLYQALGGGWVPAQDTGLFIESDVSAAAEVP